MSDNSKKLKRSSRFNASIVTPFVKIFKRPVMKLTGVQVEKYTPKSDEFIVISNHADALDPGYIMVSLNRYIRFIASDHIARAPIGGWIVRNLGGVIVKHREKDSSVLIDDIVANARAGVPVAIFAEGGTSFNGETRFISKRTAQMVKDCGTALITYRFVGGYLRFPKWTTHARKGPVFGKVVNEYSAEEIAAMSVDEVYEIIKRDTYVNCYDEQRKNTYEYVGENLAEHLECIIYTCPECKQVGTLHSKGDYCKCDNCGYGIRVGTDAFFHGTDGKEAVFDNTCDWDKWQREIWKEKLLSAKDGELIHEDKKQKVISVDGTNKNVLTEDGVVQLYKDKFVVKINGEDYEMPFDKISVQTVSNSALVLIDDKNYFDIRSSIPRSATKYVAAWRYLTGKDYF
ncbi:MAG: 1-acyl-sn-glycerol-3-phosphate acyltransferase [Clostridia bacterium]|nr:1-acyl-sn-glycerol-3-phosphate acyltransferase [Clostridia bacterium]